MTSNGAVRTVECPEWGRVCGRGEELFIENCKRRAVLEVKIGRERYAFKIIRRALLVHTQAGPGEELSPNFLTPKSVLVRVALTNALFRGDESIRLDEEEPVELGMRRLIDPNRVDEVREAARRGVELVRRMGPITREEMQRFIHDEGIDPDI